MKSDLFKYVKRVFDNVDILCGQTNHFQMFLTQNPSLQPNQSSHQRSPEIMSSVLDLTPLSFSKEQLTPHSENTVFSLSHSPTLWTAQAPPGNCEYYWHAILLMTSGGSVLICGMVLSGLYFAGISVMATNILGPALLSLGLMVLVVGVVLVPITQEMRYQSATKRLCNHYKPQVNQ